MDEYLEMFALMTRSCAGLRRPGAAALDLAYVACGRLDGFFERGLKPWDMAAGMLLITEAGGLVGNYAGESRQMEQGEVLAGNPKAFAQMVRLLSPYRWTTPSRPPRSKRRTAARCSVQQAPPGACFFGHRRACTRSATPSA